MFRIFVTSIILWYEKFSCFSFVFFYFIYSLISDKTVEHFLLLTNFYKFRFGIHKRYGQKNWVYKKIQTFFLSLHSFFIFISLLMYSLFFFIRHLYVNIPHAEVQMVLCCLSLHSSCIRLQFLLLYSITILFFIRFIFWLIAHIFVSSFYSRLLYFFFLLFLLLHYRNRARSACKGLISFFLLPLEKFWRNCLRWSLKFKNNILQIVFKLELMLKWWKLCNKLQD